MKNILLILMMCFALNNYSWAGSGAGKVKHLMVHKGDVVMFSVGSHVNKPLCSTVSDHWALSLLTEKGKSMYALLLASAAQGHVVNVKGNDTCTAWGDRETPYNMWVDY